MVFIFIKAIYSCGCQRLIRFGIRSDKSCLVILEGEGGVCLKKMNESSSTRAAERGWSERGRAPAPRFRLQARVEVRGETACTELGRTRKGAKGMGRDIYTPSSCLQYRRCQSGAVGI